MPYLGNQHRAKGRAWRDGLHRALDAKAAELRLPHRNAVIDLLAMQLIEAGLQGEPWALKEFAERLEGKPETLRDEGGDEGEEASRLVINA